MKIVIFGLAKTGTSALFYKIRNSLSEDTISLFEPVSRGALSELRVRLISAMRRQGERDVLAKVLPFERSRMARVGDFANFDKQILTVRDPRDRLVSGLLYRAYDANFLDREDAVRTIVDLLRQKEAEPRSVSMKLIVDTYSKLGDRPRSLEAWMHSYRHHSIEWPLAFHGERPHLYEFRYESMVDGHYAGLEAYMDMALTGPAAVDEEVKRVVRTKSYGGWRDWFTAEDIDFVGPAIQPYLDRYYPDADWDLTESPVIDPDHGSRYVARIANEKRAKLKLPRLNLS